MTITITAFERTSSAFHLPPWITLVAGRRSA